MNDKKLDYQFFLDITVSDVEHNLIHLRHSEESSTVSQNDTISNEEKGIQCYIFVYQFTTHTHIHTHTHILKNKTSTNIHRSRATY